MKIECFPITFENDKFIDSKGNIILDLNGEDDLKKQKFIETILHCANYGKRALISRKMKSFPNMTMKEAEMLVDMEVGNLGYTKCNQGDESLIYTINLVNGVKKEKRVIYYKQK